MAKLKCVNKVRINGELKDQSDFTEEEFREIMEQISDRAMQRIGYEKVKEDKTAQAGGERTGSNEKEGSNGADRERDCPDRGGRSSSIHILVADNVQCAV